MTTPRRTVTARERPWPLTAWIARQRDLGFPGVILDGRGPSPATVALKACERAADIGPVTAFDFSGATRPWQRRTKPTESRISSRSEAVGIRWRLDVHFGTAFSATSEIVNGITLEAVDAALLNDFRGDAVMELDGSGRAYAYNPHFAEDSVKRSAT